MFTVLHTILDTISPLIFFDVITASMKVFTLCLITFLFAFVDARLEWRETLYSSVEDGDKYITRTLKKKRKAPKSAQTTDGAIAAASVKSTKAPSVASAKSTKAPSVASVKSTKAPSVASVKSTKAPSVASVKSTKAPTVKSAKRRRMLSSVGSN